MSILTKAIDESRRRTQGQHKDTSAASASPLTRAIDQARQRQAGGGGASPGAQAGAAVLPQAGRSAPRGGMPEWLSKPSFAPVPGARSSRAVREEMDGVDRAMGALREKRDGLNAQAQALDSRTLGMKRRAGAYAGVVGHGAAAQSAQLRRQAQELEQEMKRLEQGRTALQTEWDRADTREFDQLRQTPEFRAAVDKAMAPTSGIPEVTTTYSKYIDLSRAMSYFQAKARGDERWAAAVRQNADMALERVDERQRDRLAYYVGMGDYEGALDYLNRIMPELNQAEAEQVEQGLAEWAQEHPVLGAATNMVSWPLSIPAYAANAGQAAKNAVTGQDGRDRHLNAYVGPRIGSGTAQGTQEAARRAAAQTFGSEAAGEAAAFLTGTGLSIGQNAGQIALLGPGSLPAMAMSAAGSSTADALDRGAAPGQAFAVGTAAGAIEALTEKIPLDNLFRLAKEGGGNGVKAVVKEVLQQMGTEATEEAVSEIANNIVDAAVMGEKSEFWSYVRELQEEGVPKREAERRALLKFYLLDTAASAAGGAISGGVMGGGALAANQIGSRRGQDQSRSAGALQAEDAVDLAYASMGENGLFSPEAGQMVKLAAEALGRPGKDAWGQGIVTLPKAENGVQTPQKAAEIGRSGDVAEQIAFVERSLRESYERGDIDEEGYQDAVARVREAQADIAGSRQALEAARAAARQDTQEAAQSVDGGGQRLQEITAEAQRLRQDYGQGKISSEAFDRAMDGLQAEAELTGMEASEARKLLDGGPSYMTEGSRSDGTATGEQLSGGDGGRLSGAGAGGENGSLAEGGPQGPADAGGGTGYRDDFGRPLRTEAVSSKELGLAGGTDARTVRVLPEDMWTGALRTIARKVRRETGLPVRFTLGPMETVRSDGQIQRVRGAYNENGIFVQADNRTATAEQIADHETFHSYAQTDPGLVQAAAEAVTERYGREELRDILAVYAKNLRGVADVSELDTMDAQTLAQLKNEMLADAFAGINAFGTQAAKYQETVYETVEDREAAMPRSRENAQALDQRRGPPDTYSIEYDGDNQPFVTVEEDILAGVPRAEWTTKVKKVLAERFPAGVRVGKNTIKINRQSRAEMTFSEYTKRLRRDDGSAYADKFRAAANADEIILASRDYINEGLKHSRKDNIRDFARGTVQLRVGSSDYTADVVVGTTSGGEMLLYDIVNLKPTQINERNGHTVRPNQVESHRSGTPVSSRSDTEFTAQPHEAGRAVDSSTPTQSAAPASDKTNIARDDSPVKPWDGTLPRGTDGELTLPGGQERYSAQEEVPDGLTLPTLAETQARRAQAAQAAQENAGSVSDSGTFTVDALPTTAREQLRKAERRMTVRLGKKLGLPPDMDSEFLRDISRNISNEYLENGGVSRDLCDKSFEQAYAQSIQIAHVLSDKYKNVGDYLRTTSITVDENTRWAVTDQDDWSDSLSTIRILTRSGAVRFVNSDGVDVNTAYKDLQNMAPDLFPEDITHREDQLRYILDTARTLQIAQQRAEEADGPDADAFKRETWRDFDDAIAEGIKDLERVKQYADGRAERARARSEGNIAPATKGRSDVSGVQKPDMDRDHAQPVRTHDEMGQLRAELEEALPAKALSYLNRAEGRLIRKTGELLSVPKSAQREFLRDIVWDISTEYLSSGKVSQETQDRLFERAYEESVKVDREYYDTYKHVREYLRSTPITVSEKVKGDITGYSAWRHGALGTLRLVKKGGNGPDTAYMELQHMAPELFPDSITHPADQLRHILETAKGIRAAEQNLDEFYGTNAEEFKTWVWKDFDEAVADFVGELRQVKRYTEERTGKALKKQQQAAQERFTPKTAQEAATAYRKLKEAQRTYNRVSARNLLTDDDNAQIFNLLRGSIRLDQLDPKRYHVQGIKEVYEAKLEYEQLAGQIQAWNKQRKAQLMEQADGFLETANRWKDKKAGILYARETMERNIRDIVPDRALADRINKAYFQPVHQAAAEANKTKNHYRDRVRALELSRKAAKGDAVSEAYAVQLLGEAEDNIRRLEESHGQKTEQDGRTLQEWQAAIGELWEKSPSLDQNKIRSAVKEFRAIYDELFQQMNEARVRNGYEPVSYRQGYFPHFQADSESLMAQFGRALGIDTAVTGLPTTINGLTHTFKPGIQWFGNALERKGFETAYDAVQGFDRYIEGAADVIHQTDSIQALRALATQARYRTGDEGLRHQIDRVRANEQLTEQEKQALIDEINKEGKFALSNFVVELDEYTNLLANKKSRADRNMEQALGRRMYNIVKGLESRVAANMVAVNPASWLTNFVPLTQGWGAVKSRFMLEGMWDTLKAYKADDGMVGMSSFLTNRRGSDPIVKTWQQNASAVLSTPMEWIDCFTADSLVRARFKQNRAAGLSEAASIEEADAWAAGVMADRSKGSTPTLFNRSNPLTKVFTQFQLEVNNQLSYLFKDLPSDAGKKGVAALAAMLFKVFVGAYLYNEVYEYFVGRRCALDPIGILNDSVGDFTGYQLPNLVELGVGAVTGDIPSFETEKKNPYEAVAGLAGNVADELPFIGGVLGGGRVPISSALPDWGNLGKAILNDQWSGEKRLSTAARELVKLLTYGILPFGGGQVKKIYQGLKTVLEGGSYTVDNKGNDILQYPVFNETAQDKLLTLPTALTFGKSALPTAREWAERGFKSMSAKQTACYQGMTELGVPQRDAYALLQAIGDVEAPSGEDVAATEKAAYQKRKLLQEADISAQGKGVVYYGLMASDKERTLMDGLAESGADMGETARVLMALKDAGAELKGADASAAKKGAIAESSLSEEEKNAVFCYVLGKDSRGAALSGKLEEAGLDKRSAAAVANAVNALTPQEGRKTVSNVQKWRAAVDAAKGSQAQEAALRTVMEDGARMKFEIASGYGIKPEAWVQVKEALPQFDADGNGSFSSREVKNAIDALAGSGALLAPWDKEPIRLSREEKAVLWQLFTGSKSGGGNPYSVRVGRKVGKELERAKEEEREALHEDF